MITPYRKKLIEVVLPPDAINKASRSVTPIGYTLFAGCSSESPNSRPRAQTTTSASDRPAASRNGNHNDNPWNRGAGAAAR